MTPIYLDYQATTPLAPEAFETMLPWLRDNFGNPHSSHVMGRAASAAVEHARALILNALDMPAGRLVFTSGATEALNLGIQGAAPGDIVTVATEHAAVLDTVEALRENGRKVTLLPVDADGLVDLGAAQQAIVPGVSLVIAMLVNNEIGVVQPIEQLIALTNAAGAQFLCDAVQGFGRVPIPNGCDMVAISAHKIHGPKGIGGLWLRDGVTLKPQTHGGGQEQGLRSGTLSPALCVGFGEAARLLAERRETDAVHLEELWTKALEIFDGWVLNGAVNPRYHGNINIRIHGLDGARLLSECRSVAFSLGSACASGSGRPSHVLQAIGLSEKDARSSVRLGFGRYTTMEELERAGRMINEAVARQGTPP